MITSNEESFCQGCIAGMAIMAVSMVVLIGLVINPYTRRYQRDKAIEAGVAEWIIDSKTGETTFRYITKAEKEAENDDE